jgi:CDP-paratose 2-epimerase
LGKPLNIYGNGKQVRDLLYIDDVIEAFDLTFQRIEKVKGEAMNLGGGRENVASLLETIRHLESITGKTMPLNFKAWRLGDNKCYYTDNRKAHQLLDWTPKVQWKEGVNRTFSWVQKNLAEVSTVIHV